MTALTRLRCPSLHLLTTSTPLHPTSPPTSISLSTRLSSTPYSTMTTNTLPSDYKPDFIIVGYVISPSWPRTTSNSLAAAEQQAASLPPVSPPTSPHTLFSSSKPAPQTIMIRASSSSETGSPSSVASWTTTTPPFRSPWGIHTSAIREPRSWVAAALTTR